MSNESQSNKDDSDITNLQENFQKQQVKIIALKELVRKSEAAHGMSTSSAQEKVKNIAQRLTHLKSKARSRQSLERSFSEFNDNPIIEESIMHTDYKTPLTSADVSTSSPDVPFRARSETPGSEKIQLLRQQMEQNKLKIAKRESSKREIEEMVIQLKARIDSTQQSLERSSELGRSMGDLTSLTSTPVKSTFKSSSDLSFSTFNLDKERIKFLENRVRILEKQLEKEKSYPKSEGEAAEKILKLENKILDLEENLKEKECVIEARTQAVSLMSENLSAKSKTTVDTLEDTRQEMFRMQANFLELEENYKLQIEKLTSELNKKTQRIEKLEETNDILGKERFDLTMKNAELEGENQDVQECMEKINELNELTESLQRKIEFLKKEKSDESEKNDEVDKMKQIAEEYATKIQSLQERINELEKENDDLKIFAQQSQILQPDNNNGANTNYVSSLEAQIEVQKEEIQNNLTKIKNLEDQLTEKTIEYNVLSANFSVLQEKLRSSTPKSLFSKSTDEESEHEISKLKSQLDEANKSMIKIKLKTKQLQKEVDGFKKISDVHSEVIRLTEENQHLQQKITEFEEEKKEFMLRLASGEGGVFSENELEKKIHILETTCQNQTSAIQLLEEQKLDMTENLNTTRQELETLKDQIQEIDKEEAARVVSHMETIQLEEQINNFVSQINDLNDTVSHQKDKITALHENIEMIEQEKMNLNKKVDHYIAENIELLDKIEKLSKSSSSAESIEIVERLTQQEKLEIEAFNKRLEEERIQHDSPLPISSLADDGDNGTMEQELSESLTKLREESSELMHKIELFTTERREVLEKMEGLTSENQENVRKINELLQEKSNLENDMEELKTEMEIIKRKYEETLHEKEDLLKDITEIRTSKTVIINELNSLKKEKCSIKELSAKQNVIEECEKCLTRLSTELDNYKKSSDKSSKLSISKKLAKEAKNVHQQMNDLLKQLKNNSKNEVVEFDFTNLVKKCEELEKIGESIQTEFNNLKMEAEGKEAEIQRINLEMTSLKELSNNFDKLINEKEISCQNQIDSLNRLRKELENKLYTSEKEVDILKTLVAEQKQQLIDSYTERETEINEKLEQVQSYELEIEKLKDELKATQVEKRESYDEYNTKLQRNIEELQGLLRSNESLLEEQSRELMNKQETIDALNNQIVDLYKTMEENSNKIIEKDDEILFIQDILDTKKKTLEKVMKENDENKAVIEKLLVELHSHSSDNLAQLDNLKTIELKNSHLEARVKELEKINADLTERTKEQHEKLKKFAANLKKKVAQCNELEAKVKQLEELLQQSNVPSQVSTSTGINVSEYEAKIADYESTVKEYQKEYDALKSLLSEQTQRYQNDLATLRNENQILQIEKIDALKQCGDLEMQIESLRLECDNLRSEQKEFDSLKTALHKDIESKQQTITDLQSQVDVHLSIIREKDEKINSMLSEVDTKNKKFEKCKAVLKEKYKEIQRLCNENEELKQLQKMESTNEKEMKTNRDLEKEYETLKEEHSKLIEKYEIEKVVFKETISKLETVHDAILAKLQEDQGYIESIETENTNYKEKIMKLESCLASFEERRASIERHAKVLDSQLQKRTDEYEKNEDALVHRLNLLSEHDDLIGRRLLETQEEKEELIEKLNHVKQDYSDLMHRFSAIEKEVQRFKSEDYESLKTENSILKEQIEINRGEMNKLQQNFDYQLAQKHAEIDELENELSIQLKTINGEKRILQENLEKAKDEIVELKDENVRLKENVNSLEQIKNDLERESTWIKMQNENLAQDQLELQELRMQVVQDKTEIDNLTHQLDTFMQNHEIELNALRTQISELDSMRMQVSQNQTDDQVFIETENKKLKELLAEKDAVIENYQRQNLQLQMASTSTSQHIDPFYSVVDSSSISQTDDQFTENMEIVALREKHQKLESELAQARTMAAEKDDQLAKLYRDVSEVQEELNGVRQKCSDLQAKYIEKQKELDALKADSEQANRPTDIISVFTSEQPTTSVFDEIFTPRSVSSLGGGVQVHDQKKIEDLERNVSDLEKYATDLENKLKHLTTIHEDSLIQLQERNRSHEESVKLYEEKIRNLEERILELQIVENRPVKEEEEKSTSYEYSDGMDKSDEPVIEKPIVPKKAYVLYPDPSSESLLAESNDDWGWGSADASLEAKHCEQQMAGQMSQFQSDASLKNKLKEYQERVQELELERNRLDEQKVELQVKSGKMMKKLKEYKNTIDQLRATTQPFRKSSSIESNDLDLAIQDELKSQVEGLEKKLMEMKKQLEKEVSEKENLLKRIEMLTSGNDKMMEMKEKQDVTIQMYQSEIFKLNDKIRSLSDWDNMGDKSKKSSQDNQESTINISSTNEDFESLKELKQELEDMRADRDELQALLDEEKENSKISETKIKELQLKIIALEESLDNLKCCDAERQSLVTQLNEMRTTNENLQIQLKEYQSITNQLSNESGSIKSQLETINNEHKKKLNENLSLTRELQEWVDKSNHLSEEIEKMRTSTQGSNSNVEDNQKELELKMQELSAALQYKNDEVFYLRQSIEEITRNDRTQSLLEEITSKDQEISQLKQNAQIMEEEKKELQKLIEKVNSDSEVSKLKEEITALQEEVRNHKTEKNQMEEELKVLNNHVIANIEIEDKMKQAALELDTKNIEITELKNSLEILKRKQESEKEMTLLVDTKSISETDLQEINARWEEVVEQKCGEVANSWRQHLEQREEEFKKIERDLQERLRLLQYSENTEKIESLADRNESEDSEIIQRMQSVLESQELEIVTLKEQLAMRSAEYARLAARHDPYGQTTTSNSVFEMKFNQKPSKSGGESAAAVPKSELDLALYMLHQRDMRCEELTLELVNLLEERDTLQLKLSNSLRQLEEIKRAKCTESGSDSDPGVSLTDSPINSAANKESVISSQTADITNESSELSAKLSQLHTVSHGRDKRLWEERDQRQRQMEQIQQDVANMPPEAVSEIVGTDLSNIIESPSTAILNWLWGKNSSNVP